MCCFPFRRFSNFICNVLKVSVLLSSLVIDIYVTYNRLTSPWKCDHFSFSGYRQSSAVEAMIVLIGVHAMMYLLQYNPNKSMAYFTKVCRAVGAVAIFFEMICVPFSIPSLDNVGVVAN